MDHVVKYFRDKNIDELEHQIDIDNIFDMFDKIGCMYVNVGRGEGIGRMYRYLSRHFFISYNWEWINVFDENVCQVYEQPYSWDECETCHRTKKTLDKYHIHKNGFLENDDSLLENCRESFKYKHRYKENEYGNY